MIRWHRGVVVITTAQVHSTNWCRGVAVITTVQLHSTKPELRFCTGSNLARSGSDIHDGQDLW